VEAKGGAKKSKREIKANATGSNLLGTRGTGFLVFVEEKDMNPLKNDPKKGIHAIEANL
jgi:hypothetical protein